MSEKQIFALKILVNYFIISITLALQNSTGNKFRKGYLYDKINEKYISDFAINIFLPTFKNT